MIDELLIDRITLKRVSDTLLSGLTLPFSSSINKIFTTQPVVLEFVVPAGTTSSYSITGVKNNAGVSETVVFTSGNSRVVTINAFDGITTISSSGGNSTTASVYLRGQSGQPVFEETSVLTNYPARFSKNRQGTLVIRREQLTVQDEHVVFINYGPNKIKPKDKIIDDSTSDVFLIADVDDVKDGNTYHHSELIVNLIDRGLE